MSADSSRSELEPVLCGQARIQTLDFACLVLLFLEGRNFPRASGVEVRFVNLRCESERRHRRGHGV